MAWGLGLGVDTRVGAEMDADGVVNICSGCCVDIFS